MVVVIAHRDELWLIAIQCGCFWKEPSGGRVELGAVPCVVFISALLTVSDGFLRFCAHWWRSCLKRQHAVSESIARCYEKCLFETNHGRFWQKSMAGACRGPACRHGRLSFSSF